MTLLVQAVLAVIAARVLPLRVLLAPSVRRSSSRRSAEEVASAIRRIPFTNCLTRSLAATLLIPRAELRLAFHRHAAHAWVELDGRAILDEPAPMSWEPFKLSPR
ncbi:MAG TPA: lasso peptide biosynthesis B2 protein [Thermoanaerobaculia bacterium]|nr:lasso peptide biosynthesis B2 protein [Thermoanaerobaculia bacterium]